MKLKITVPNKVINKFKNNVKNQWGPILNFGEKLLFLSKLNVIKLPILQNKMPQHLYNLNSG